MKTLTSRYTILWGVLFALAVSATAPSAAAADSDAAALVGVVAEVQNPKAGKALWRQDADGSWSDVMILQNLEQGNQLAVEGGILMRVFLFRDKNLVELTTATASVATPYSVDEKKVKDENTRKMIEGLKFVSSSLPGPMRDEDLQMADLLTRSPEPYCVLAAPRNTRIESATPTFEWIESYSQSITLTLSLDGQTVWQIQSGEGVSRLEYPADQKPLEAGRTYTLRLESPGSQPDTSNCIYEPLSKGDVKDEAEWEESLPPKTEVAGAVLRATRDIANHRLDRARATLTEAIALHPDDLTLHGLLIAVYLEQGNGCLADREIELYEKIKGS
ncbi:bacterial transcriptional activator domain-containing protein [Candidatus Sumerlaeota bacterium]|nr:bacterial transcriptional activator domain-containing protein [Candidatus Sumerlaeota bacterium]